MYVYARILVYIWYRGAELRGENAWRRLRNVATQKFNVEENGNSAKKEKEEFGQAG